MKSFMNTNVVVLGACAMMAVCLATPQNTQVDSSIITNRPNRPVRSLYPNPHIGLVQNFQEEADAAEFKAGSHTIVLLGVPVDKEAPVPGIVSNLQPQVLKSEDN